MDDIEHCHRPRCAVGSTLPHTSVAVYTPMLANITPQVQRPPRFDGTCRSGTPSMLRVLPTRIVAPEIWTPLPASEVCTDKLCHNAPYTACNQPRRQIARQRRHQVMLVVEPALMVVVRTCSLRDFWPRPNSPTCSACGSVSRWARRWVPSSIQSW